MRKTKTRTIQTLEDAEAWFDNVDLGEREIQGELRWFLSKNEIQGRFSDLGADAQELVLGELMGKELEWEEQL